MIDRTLSLVIEGVVRATSNYDTTLDTICAEIEAAMATDVTRGATLRTASLLQSHLIMTTVTGP